ncbi:MAG: DUF2855 family protein [Chitinophagales bacterium]
MILETDYLIVGSGAVGMAFADILVTETNFNIIIVDRYAKPGGHWNMAYPFVTLHQPSQFYGVSSKELSKGRKDEVGLNKGLYDLATGAEVSAYFDEVMRNQFLPTGRVQYFPLCEYKGDYKFTSKLTGEEFEVKVNKKLVDATYLKTAVPSTHTPNFTIAPEVRFMPLNDLPKITLPPKGFVVIGGGKTGIDACLWLLDNRVNPDKITWIVSRDAWLIDRAKIQPTEEFFEATMGGQAAQFEAAAKATSIENLFDRLEAAGVLLRLDKSVRPQMFHGATISQAEATELRRIKNVVRKGRVQSIETDKIVFKNDTIPTSIEHIHIDCSATPIRTDLPKTPIFKGNVITPQTVRSYQPIFSAAFVAHIEANFEEEKEKNKICGIVPLPNHDTDWIRMLAALMMNQFTWSQYKELRKWLLGNRLDGFSEMVKNASKEDAPKQALLKKMKQYSMPAMMKLQQFIRELDAVENEKKALQRPQFQIRRDLFFKGRLTETPETELQIGEGELLVKIDKFAFTSNNITYAVAGNQIGYWQFFPPAGEDTEGWGIIPVWGFADVVESNVEHIPVGDRFFGYFPPASHLKMKPIKISDQQFIEGSEHRSKLPQGYNLYRRVNAEKGYNSAMDKGRALLYPLYLTSFCLWDALQDEEWYGAKQVLVLSASSKTSIGLGYALQADENSPQVIGVTSQRNVEMVKGLNIYDQTTTYDAISEIDANIPTVIVDMSGNQKLLVDLHAHLGDNMKFTINVGLTHWTNARPKKGIITERSEFFFAPGHIQRRIKEWGFAGFSQKSNAFMMETIAKTSKWLQFRKVDGLQGMADIHQAVCNGEIPANEGLIVEL